jgi:hypothetical protein
MYDRTRVRNGNGKRVVLSCRARRFLQSSLPSRPLQFVDLTRLLGASPALRGGRDKESTRSGEKLAEAAGPLVLCLRLSPTINAKAFGMLYLECSFVSNVSNKHLYSVR